MESRTRPFPGFFVGRENETCGGAVNETNDRQ